MHIVRQQGDRLELSGPPGGAGGVVLLAVVGTAMTGGGGLFLSVGRSSDVMLMIMGGLAVAVGLLMLAGGLGLALTRDRLELDAVTRQGTWTRRLLGRNVQRPIEFAFDRTRHVTVRGFVESEPGAAGRGGGGSVEKVRARLLLAKPKQAIVLDEAERRHAPRIRAVAQAVATLLDLEVEDSTIRARQ